MLVSNDFWCFIFISWHIQVGGAQLILKTRNFYFVPNECASLTNTVAFRIIWNNLYQSIFISSRPFHKNIVRSRLESCISGRCEGQTDVLLSAIQVYRPQMDSGWKKARICVPVWVLWQSTRRREVKGSSRPSLGKSYLFVPWRLLANKGISVVPGQRGSCWKAGRWLWEAQETVSARLRLGGGQGARTEVLEWGNGGSCSSTSSSRNRLWQV